MSLYNDDRSNGPYKIAHHWLQPVDLGHLSGATDETCWRGLNPVNILRIIRGHVNQATTQDVHYRDISVTYSGCEVHRTLAESAHLARKISTFTVIQDNFFSVQFWIKHVTVTCHNFRDMPRSEIPVDVLRDILGYVDKADLATICLLNKSVALAHRMSFIATYLLRLSEHPKSNRRLPSRPILRKEFARSNRVTKTNI
jgi:hypothetical protein